MDKELTSKVQQAKGLRERSPSVEITTLHTRDDLDQGDLAHHHTLGLQPGQAAPGVLVAELQRLLENLTDRVEELEPDPE